ncbi:MAG: RICIN domain-containing protein [Bacteroidota bacterium]
MKILKLNLEKAYEALPAVVLKNSMTIFLSLSLFFLGCAKKENSVKAKELSTPEIGNSAPNLNVAGSDFTIIVMPDTQNYMSGYFGGLYVMFTDQINWIINNVTAQNIVYVIGLGDEVEHGDTAGTTYDEWTEAATNGYYRLDAAGIPYGVAVGNHEQTPVNGSILTVTTNKFNQYFGRNHFAGKSFYGGNLAGSGSNANNSHYDLFSAGGTDFLVIYLEFDYSNQQAATLDDWAWGLCNTYSSRKVIVVTHYMIGIGDPASFGAQGQGLYTRLKDRPNVFMFLGGHIYGADNSGEGYREDTNSATGQTIRSYLSDYQQRQVGGVNKGGNGLLRIMKFSVTNDDVTVKTYSPYTGSYETSVTSNFTKPLFGPAPTAPLADGNYKILNVNSGKAVVVYNAVTTNGGNVVQWDYTSVPATNDEWTLSQIGTSGYYKILNRNSGKALAVYNASTANGADLVQWDYTSAPSYNDEWALISVGSGKYKLINRSTGMCASIQGASLTNGAQVEQWDYLGQTSEQFTFTAVP